MTSMINNHTNGHSRVSEMAAFLGQPFTFAGRIARHIRERRELNRMLAFSRLSADGYRIAARRDAAEGPRSVVAGVRSCRCLWPIKASLLRPLHVP